MRRPGSHKNRGAMTAGCDRSGRASADNDQSRAGSHPARVLHSRRVAATMRHVFVTVGVMLGIVAGAPAVGVASSVSSDSAFTPRIARYMALRRQAEQRVSGPRVSDNRVEIDRAADALAEAIRTARQRAIQGDIFSARIAADFRRIIESVSRKEQMRAGLSELRARVSGEPPPPPTVNGRFDWNLDTGIPPLLIDALPALPPELQYRVVGSDLVIVDITAGLVIDILPAALPDRR
jgi:hypothetical protein